MTRLIRAELLKLRTTQVWLWLLLLALAAGALIVIGGLASDSTTSAADVPDVFANANGTLIVAFILGTLGITTEYRYQTITPTVLQTPSRWMVIGAKLLTYSLVGLAYAAICLVVQLAIAIPWLSAKNIDFHLSDPDVERAVFGPFLLFAMFAIIGIGVGALIRNQIVALVSGLVFLLVINNIIPAIPGVKHVYAYTPAGAVTEIVFPPTENTPNGVHLIGADGGLLVLLAWALVPALAGAAYAMNRDIT
jgi:ABC-type transport system involved in multi-copper enzyme maturation permease subunit